MLALWLMSLTCSQASPAPARTLTLGEAVELAMRSAPELARADVDRKRADLATVRAELERFDIRVDAELQELFVASGLGRDATSSLLGTSNLSARATVPLYAGGRISNGIRQAEQLEQASFQQLVEEKRSTAIAVARAYWSVRKIALLSEVQAEAVERATGAEDIAKARLDAGIAPPIDANRARARRLQAEATLGDLQGRLTTASAQLGALLGAQESLIPSDGLRIPDGLPATTEELLAQATRSRADLRAAELHADASETGIELARAAYYPELSAGALVQLGNNPTLAGVGARGVSDAANPFANMSGDVQLGIVLSINLFDTFSTQTAVEDAKLLAARAELEKRRVGRVIDADVRVARAKIEHQHATLQRLAPAEALARDNLEIIQKRYENGEALVSDLIDAEIELLELERQRTDATAELQLAWLELAAALGVIVGDTPSPGATP
ncbi:TolC family protein [Myxococcota bacterium]|nr:TolC family protein [Myxococcota bacterium]